MIRCATPADIPAITALGVEALLNNAYPHMVVDKEKIMSVARQAVSSAQHFAWVAEQGGKIVGAVVAIVHDCMFYERKQASVVMFWCPAPGEGVKLIREFLRWARSRPSIKLVGFTVEYDADPRIGKLLQRLGLNKTLPVYLETR